MSSIIWLIVLVGLVQLPIACDILHHAFPASRIPRLAAAATRPMFQVMSAACGVLALYLFFGTFLPVHIHQRAFDRVSFESDSKSVELTERTTGDVVYAVILSIIAVYIVLTMMWHYTVASAGAASPPKAENGSIATQSNQSNEPVRRCVTCNIDKHQGVHHCRTCNRCITLFDHHCPFTASCIGESNFRSFWLWLTICTIGLTYSCILSFEAFNRCIWLRSALPKIEDTLRFQDTLNWMYDTSNDHEYHQSINQPFWTLQYCRSMGNLPLTFLCVALGLTSVGLLWAGQTWLVARRMTTMEWIVGIGKRMNMHKEDNEHAHGHDDVEGCSTGCSSKSSNQTIKPSINHTVQQNPSPKKSWSLIHRNESLNRTLLPDAVWSLLDRCSGRTRQSAKRSRSP